MLRQQDDLTDPQRDVLRWLIDTYGTEREFSGSELEGYYAEKRERETGITTTPSLGTCRGWWRVGGAMCRRLTRKGLLASKHHERYTTYRVMPWAAKAVAK